MTDPQPPRRLEPSGRRAAPSPSAAREVHRLGFGAMQITGDGIWGEPADRASACASCAGPSSWASTSSTPPTPTVPRSARTSSSRPSTPTPRSWSSPPRPGSPAGPGQWLPVGRPEYLRQQCEMSLRRLGRRGIDLFQLHRIDPKVPADEQFGLLADLSTRARWPHVGLEPGQRGRDRGGPASRPRRQRAEPVQPDRPLLRGRARLLRGRGDRLHPVVPDRRRRPRQPGRTGRRRASTRPGPRPSQVALAWLLHRSPVMLPIPGTKSVGHVEENCEAATLELTDDQVAVLGRRTAATDGPERLYRPRLTGAEHHRAPIAPRR